MTEHSDKALFTTRDPGIGLFASCLKAGAPMPITPGMRILEVGSCEADWLHMAHEVWPDVHLVGIDQRGPDVVDGDGMVTRIKADVMNGDLFPPNSFDAVVSLSALEHIGLGHYGDVKHPDGDSIALENIWRWLKPRGWLYFDVPYDPIAYRVQTTECRVYDDAAIEGRLLDSFPMLWQDEASRFSTYVHAKDVRTLLPKPTEPVTPFHYVAMVWRKP